MDYNRTGRALGIGVRVLGRMAQKKLEPGTPQQAAQVQERNSAPAQQGARIREGARRFGQSFFGPLRRAGHSLTLEIAGVFFALFAAWFLQYAWKLRAFARTGQEHHRFLIYVGLAIVFLYFTVSTFLRARRAARKR